MNNFLVFGRDCAADLARAIERNRRCSPAYIEDFAIECEPKMWGRWDSKTGSYFCAGPKGDIMKHYQTITSKALMLTFAIVAVGILMMPVHDAGAAQRMVLGEYFTDTY